METPRRLRDSEERLRLATEAAGVGIFEIDVETGRVHYSPELAAMLGFPGVRSTTVENAMARVHRDDAKRVGKLYYAALAPSGDGRLRMDFRFVKPGGEVRWMTWNGQVEFRDSEGSRVATRILGACSDISERKQAEADLRDTGAFLRDILDSMPQHVCVLDRNGLVRAVNEPWVRFARDNDAVMNRIGVGMDYIEVCRVAAKQGDENAHEILRGLEALMAGARDSFVHEYPCHSPDVQRWFEIHASRLTSNPAGFVISHLDVTSRKHAEENIRLLMREVNHRSKNLLELIQAIARQTAATEPRDFLVRFDERVQSLASAQDLLVKNEWQAVPLADLVHSQISHFADLIGERVTIGGVPVALAPAAAQTIGMALHELATNAAKYGALSTASGRIGISWSVHGGGASRPQFVLSWEEQGGAPVVRPERRGFGSFVTSEMVEMSLDGKVTVEYAPSGLKWSLACDAGRIVEGQATTVGA